MSSPDIHLSSDQVGLDVQKDGKEVIRKMSQARPNGGSAPVVKMHHLKEEKSCGSEEFEKGQ